MKSLLCVAGVVLASLVAGCHGSSAVDVGTERQAILEADRAWAAAAAAGDVQKLSAFWADDAINFFPDRPVAVGREGIADLVKKNRSVPGFSLSWTPREAVVSESGDIGYSYGTFDLAFETPAGEKVTKTGNYVCIWKKQHDGSWKCAVESTIFGPHFQ